jgi:hypothetical protein
MRLDEPRDRHIAKLLRENRRAHHLGAELGDSEARGEGERGAPDAQA